MNILIFVDMEGIASVVKSSETGSKEGWWEKFRITMTNEVNAAIEGAIKAGAENIDVLDWHGNAINILPEKLNEKANLIRGMNTSPWVFMKKGLYDGAMILGIHGRHGENTVLAHTMNGISEVEINGTLVGEVELIAGLCGYYDVPIILVSSDKETVNQSLELIKNIETVATKESLSYSGAKCFHPNTVCNELIVKSEKAVNNLKKNRNSVYKFPSPLNVKFHFATLCNHPRAVELVSYIPTLEKIDNKTVGFQCESIIDFLKILTVSGAIAGPVYNSMLK